MKKKPRRKVLHHNWSSLRAEIAHVIRDKNISQEDFRPLGMYEDWRQIGENIYQRFCHIEHPTQRPGWLWAHLKCDYSAVACLPNRPETYLDRLVDAHEHVWLILDEDDKWWFYEGKIKTIQMIIDESWFDELYIVSKKYMWLICINHHDCLIAVENLFMQRLDMLKKELEEAQK